MKNKQRTITQAASNAKNASCGLLNISTHRKNHRQSKERFHCPVAGCPSLRRKGKSMSTHISEAHKHFKYNEHELVSAEAIESEPKITEQMPQGKARVASLTLGLTKSKVDRPVNMVALVEPSAQNAKNIDLITTQLDAIRANVVAMERQRKNLNYLLNTKNHDIEQLKNTIKCDHNKFEEHKRLFEQQQRTLQNDKDSIAEEKEKIKKERDDWEQKYKTACDIKNTHETAIAGLQTRISDLQENAISEDDFADVERDMVQLQNERDELHAKLEQCKTTLSFISFISFNFIQIHSFHSFICRAKCTWCSLSIHKRCFK